jgi:hypothetical protein
MPKDNAKAISEKSIFPIGNFCRYFNKRENFAKYFQNKIIFNKFVQEHNKIYVFDLPLAEIYLFLVEAC